MPVVQRIDPMSNPHMGKRLRTCAYCRVSSNSADQLNSYATQVRHYTKAIQSRADWEFVDIFADEGITGTRADKRTEFQRMIHLCNHKRIDLIITKSVSRFARNVPECLDYARMLRRQGIGIIFEENGINTLRMSDELMLSTFSAIAQEESMAISQRLKHMNRERMKRGEYVAGTAPYGYHYQDKQLVIFEPEAENVRWIFDAYLSGWSLAEIVRDLRQRHIPKKNGDDKWHTLTVQYILTNEKYVGDTLFQKTFKTDTLPFTKHKNNGELDQYYASESHEPIISREDFLAVAALMAEKSEYYGRQRPTTPYPLTKKIRCSRCGAFYIRRTGKDYTIWSCHNHIRSKELCESKRYSETQIYGALIPFLLLGVLALIMFTAVWSAGRKDLDKIQIIRHSNPYMQTHLVGLGNTSKRTLYDGFRFVMRNLIIVLAIVNLLSLWFPIDLYQQITRYISSNSVDFTTNMTWITVFISALVVVMLIRYYHYAILRYKYSLEDYMMHNRDGKSRPSEENKEKKRKNEKAKRPYSHSH